MGYVTDYTEVKQMSFRRINYNDTQKKPWSMILLFTGIKDSNKLVKWNFYYSFPLVIVCVCARVFISNFR